MPVNRISIGALNKIINGEVRTPSTCIIKFYSNSCHMCNNLKDYYEDIAGEYPDLNFFAFNIGDDPSIEKKLKFKGVPSIFLVRTGNPKPIIRAMGDPPNPNQKTWFRVSDIKNFIEKEK